MSDYEDRFEERKALTERFGKLRNELGECLCCYCQEDDSHPRPRDPALYQCLNCHSWTGSDDGYCRYCTNGCYTGKVGQSMSDMEYHPGPRERGVVGLAKVPPPIDVLEVGSNARYRYAIQAIALELGWIFYDVGEGHSFARVIKPLENDEVVYLDRKLYLSLEIIKTYKAVLGALVELRKEGAFG